MLGIWKKGFYVPASSVSLLDKMADNNKAYQRSDFIGCLGCQSCICRKVTKTIKLLSHLSCASCCPQAAASWACCFPAIPIQGRPATWAAPPPAPGVGGGGPGWSKDASAGVCANTTAPRDSWTGERPPLETSSNEERGLWLKWRRTKA